MSLLVFTPTWIDPATGEEAIQPAVETALKQQIGVDFDWHVTTENPYPIGDYRNVAHQYQRAREWFLKQGDREGRPYEALLTLEHDNLLPDPEALQRLLATPGDVVYAPYLLRHQARTLNTWQYINDRNLGMSLSHYRAELKRARDQVIHRVSGAGFGCTLIRRRVLAALEFTGATERDQNWCPDLRFAQECLRRGFTAYGRFDVPVLHYENGIWLHPFQTRRNAMQKYTAQTTVRALVAGRVVQLTQDAEIELTYEEALELSRCGYIDPAQLPERAFRAPIPPVIQAEEVEIKPQRRRRAKAERDDS